MNIAVARLATMLLLSSCNESAEPTPDAQASAKLEKRAEPVTLSPLESSALLLFENDHRQAEQAKRMKASVTKGMAAYLFDPDSAKFNDLRSGKSGAICGKVNAKNRMGAYVGYKDFVLSKDGETVYVSNYNDGLSSTVFGSFAEAYLNACASTSERKRATATIASFGEMDTEMTMDVNMTVPTIAEPSESSTDPFEED